MSTENVSKLNRLLTTQPTGIVMQTSWLKKLGYSEDLQRRYRKSKWLESVGSGAMKRTNALVTYEGAIHAMQNQSGMTVHPGGKTALQMLGLSHYLPFTQTHATVFGAAHEKIPLWFSKYDWGTKIDLHRTSFLPADLSLTKLEIKDFTIQISSAPRALLECLYLVPDEQDIMECYHFMESMNNVKPAVVQELLEKCSSIKVKRLFLYLAEKVNHSWFTRLDIHKIDVGSGKRSIIKNGVYNATYLITVPKELEENDQRNL